jgi:hypothetical protein
VIIKNKAKAQGAKEAEGGDRTGSQSSACRGWQVLEQKKRRSH